MGKQQPSKKLPKSKLTAEQQNAKLDRNAAKLKADIEAQRATGVKPTPPGKNQMWKHTGAQDSHHSRYPR